MAELTGMMASNIARFESGGNVTVQNLINWGIIKNVGILTMC